MPVAISLLPGDAVSPEGVGLLGSLCQGAAVTAPGSQEIGDHSSFDPLRLPDFSTDLGVADDVGKRDELNETAEQAALSLCLGVFTGSIAWREVGDDAHTEVIETTEQSVLPLVRHLGRYGGEELEWMTERRWSCC